jgi:hypothetical protein
MRVLKSLAPIGLALVVIAGPLACRSARPGAAVDRATVTVENQRLTDVTVYVLNSGQRIRLGRVGAHRSERFGIPAGIVSAAKEVEFLAESLSGRTQAVSQRIWVQPGDNVRLFVSP